MMYDTMMVLVWWYG